MKKILVILALVLSLCVVSSASANGYYDEATQSYFQAQVILTDVVIDPINYSETEVCKDCSWGQSFSWGGLSIGMLAVQVQGARQEMGTYGQQGISQVQHLLLKTASFELIMVQCSESYQYSYGYGYGYAR